MKKATNKVPLISEDYPDDYTSYPFISLIQYGKENFLTIIDNSDSNYIHCYVLDLCGPEGIDEKTFLEMAEKWYDHGEVTYPLSIYFAKNGAAELTSKIKRKYNIEFVSRVIGPLPEFSMTGVSGIKRKKKIPIVLGDMVLTTSIFIDC